MAAHDVLAVYEERLGSTHPHSLICQLNIASVLCQEENYPAAQAQAEAAAKGLGDCLGPAHPYTLAAQMVLASVLAGQDQRDEARRLEELVTDERERVLGPQHPDTLRCRVNLLLTRHELGDKTASAARRTVIDDLAALLGAEHPDIGVAASGGRLLCTIDPRPF
jgi:hypothetical protein